MFILGYFVVAILLFLASVCSAIETAFTAASAPKIHRLRNLGEKKVRLGLHLIKIKDKVISTFLILYSILNTVATTITTWMFITLYGDEKGAIVASLVMAVLIIVFTEVLPKAVAVARPDRIVVASSRFVEYCLQAMRPINAGLGYLVKGFRLLLRIDAQAKISPVQEVREMLDHYKNEGDIGAFDQHMIEAILDITHMKVDQIMVHRSKIFSIDHSLSSDEIIKLAINSKYRHIPLWKDNSDNIVGVLDVKMLMRKMRNQADQFSVFDIVQEPWFVPDTVVITQIIQRFKREEQNVAFIVNEYGDLLGMVSLNNVIKEIVGQIDFSEHVEASKKNLYIFSGDTTIRELNRKFDWDLPEGEVTTIAGLVMQLAGSVPEKDEKINVAGLEISVRAKTDNKILSVLIRRIDSQAN